MHSMWSMAIVVFLVGGGGGLATPLQARLMEVAEHAQTLAAALNHSAFNTANALGPWLAGMAIGAGFGWQSAGWVGCALTLGGLVLWARLGARGAAHGERHRHLTRRVPHVSANGRPARAAVFVMSAY